jgi:UDP-glucose 4-epimerase
MKRGRMLRNVLVTGGAGFIGSHVADAFLAEGARVWIVDDLSSGREANLPAAAEFHRMDIGDPALAGLFETVRFDLVTHHAAQIDVRISVDDPRRDARINIDGLLNVLENARRHRSRVLYVSSGGVVYGEPEQRPTPETAPKLPASPYGVTKLAGEQYLYYYARIHGLEYVALRYSNVYGPRQDPHGEAGVVAIFGQRILADRPLTIFGDGEQTRDYVFVGDVVRANLVAARLPVAAAGTSLDERAYNVGTGVETSVVGLAREMMAAAGHEVPVEHAAERPGELRHSSLEVAKLRAAGWSPATSLRDGLKQTLQHIERETVAR